MKKRGLLHRFTMIGRYKLCSTQGKCEIGRGTFGQIFLVTKSNGQDGEVYALKKILLTKCTDKDKKHCRDEVKQLQQTQHENVVKYIDAFEQDNYLCIVMEYCKGGNLRQYIQKQETYLGEEEFVDLLTQICNGLKNFHDRNIAHRDIKTTNILLTEDKVIKIADLGLAKVMEKVSDLTTLVGSPYFMSPEMHAGKEYTLKTDIWSLACCMYEMGTKKSLFEAADMQELIDKVHKVDIPKYAEKLPYGYSIRQLFCDMLEKDSERRPSVDKILNMLYPATERTFTEAETARVSDVKITGAIEKTSVKALDKRPGGGESKGRRTRTSPRRREQEFSRTCPPRIWSRHEDSGFDVTYLVPDTEYEMPSQGVAMCGNIVTVPVSMSDDQKEEYEEMERIEKLLLKKLDGNRGLMNQIKKKISETKNNEDDKQFLVQAEKLLGQAIFHKCKNHLKTYWIYRTGLLNINFKMA